MNSMQKFLDCCKEANIDVKTTFAFATNAGTTNKRVKCKSSYLHRTEQQSFVIYYEKSRQLFFAWSLSKPKAKQKTYFSVSTTSINESNHDGIMTIQKHICYAGHGSEIVWCFTNENIYQFLKLIKNSANPSYF